MQGPNQTFPTYIVRLDYLKENKNCDIAKTCSCFETEKKAVQRVGGRLGWQKLIRKTDRKMRLI